VALAIGETAADAVTRAIMRAVARGAVASRYTADFAQWRQRARERGEELQDARTYAAWSGRMLTAPGAPLDSGWVLDQARGIVLAPGDPNCMRPVRDGVWPLGPVEVSWTDVNALPEFRDAQARAPATPKSAPTDAAAGAPNRRGRPTPEGSPASSIDQPAAPPWDKDGPEWEAAQRDLIEWANDGDGWPSPTERSAQARFAKQLQQFAHQRGKDMGETTAKKRVKLLLEATHEQRETWCRWRRP
jgi:hypothetical protein